MPMGMYTVLGDRGTTLSGGQRQRLLIARAIVHQPRIVLLDEVTSALDNQTQARVMHSLRQLNTTKIVIRELQEINYPIIDTAAELTGAARRLFMAKVVKQLGSGGQSPAEPELSWNRGTLRKGLHELESGVTCIDNYLVINQDNGPENNSSRTQFMKRLVEFAKTNQLQVQLAYYPPYHSKYNHIDRVWAVLEHHWNGSLLDDLDTAVKFARTMTWKGKYPLVKVVTHTYGNSSLVRNMLRLRRVSTIWRRCIKRQETTPRRCRCMNGRWLSSKRPWGNSIRQKC